MKLCKLDTYKDKQKTIIIMNYTEIPGYPNYQINEYGDVWSLNSNRELKPAIDESYRYLLLCKDGTRKKFYIHQLVAMAFKGHVPDGHNIVVDHIDNDRSNNHVDNLQLVTNRFNVSKDRVRKHDLPTNVYLLENGQFGVRMLVKDARVTVGRFDTVEEAVEARDYFMELNNLL